MKLKIFTAAMILALSACAHPALAEETPRFVEGEAIVVMRGSHAPAAASARSAAPQSSGLAGGSVIQYFNPIEERQAPANAAARAASAKSETLTVAHLRAPEGVTTEEFIESLRAEPEVVSAMPNYIMQTQAVTPDDESWREQWGPAAINAPELWERGTGSEEVVVAVIDSGVIYDHPDLANNMYTFDEATANAIISENPDMLTGEVPLAGSHGAWFHSDIDLYGEGTPFSGVPVGPAPTLQNDEEADEYTVINSGTAQEMSRIGDVAGHGTHVAGIIGAVGNNSLGIAGINWKVKILAVGVHSYHMRSVPLVSDVIRGIDFVIAAKRAGVNVRAANISLGGWYRPSEMEGSAYDYKIKELSEADIVVCMAAGNDRENIDDPAGYPGQRFYPASFRYENTIAVGALMRNADGTLAPDTPGNGGIGYSNYSASGEWVDIFAPGTAILSTCRKVDLLGDASDPSGYKAMDGTSMAAPHATGAAALLASLMPEKSAAEIKKMILDGADGSIAKDGYSRCGALDLYGAWKQGAYAEEVEPGEPGGVDGAVAMLAVIELTKEAVSGIFEESAIEEIDGMLYLDAEIADKAVENLRADKAVKDVALFPVFAANDERLADNPLGAVAFAVSGEAFGKGNTLADVAICKLFPDGSALEYKEASASPGDGTFTVTEADGGTLAGPFNADKGYIITLYIEDGGDYDLDATAGSIVDPTAIVSFQKPETHGSGGGCSAVSDSAALLALAGLPLIVRRKK